MLQMIILDKPYVSDILATAVERLQVPVLKNGFSEMVAAGRDINIVAPEKLIEGLREEDAPLIYCNSEDSIEWIENNLRFSGLPEKIELCKNKVRFRRMIERLYPRFFFAEVDYGDLDDFDPSGIEKPFIIKPAVGFFSMAVQKVVSDDQWPGILRRIHYDVERVRGLYPRQVLDTGRFIIEQNIEGEEYAVDYYYDADGKPVILDILHHLFADDSDVSDRTYITSKEIIEKGSKLFYGHLARLGELGGFRNMPMHVEYRVDGADVIPVEANPMRFAAWCTTDIAWHAWGINTVEYLFRGGRPDWEEIFRGREDKVYSLVVGFVPEDIDALRVKSIDYNRFEKNFKKPLEIRRTDFRKYHVFAFVFSETDESNRDEIDRMLKADLREYIEI